MNSGKIRAVAFISFIAITVFFFAYWATTSLINSDTNTTRASVSSGSNNSSMADESGNFVESLSSVKFNLSDGSGGAGIAASSSANLTALVANDISAEFISKTKTSQNQTPEEVLKSLDSNDLVQNKLSDVLEQSTVDLVDNIPDSQLNIINDSSAESVKKYGQEYVTAMSRMGGAIFSNSDYLTKLMDDAFQNQNYTNLDQELASGESVINALKSMQVPLPAVVFHKQSLMFLSNLSVFLGSIKNISSDPLKAYLMMNKGVSLIEQQGAAATQAYQKLKALYNI